MKFAKGVMIGTLITAGVALYCTETGIVNKKKMIKQGKKWMKNMGVI